MRTKEDENHGNTRAEKTYEKLVSEKGQGEMLIVFKWNSKTNGVFVNFGPKKQHKKPSSFVRYVEKVARKRRRMVVLCKVNGVIQMLVVVCGWCSTER